MSGERILVLNAGSSSLKASVIELPDRTIARCEVDRGADASRADDHEARVAQALAELGLPARGRSAGAVAGVGHRVVHGGDRFAGPTPIDDTVLHGIRAVSDLAPLHNDVALATIEAARLALPGVPHVASFDTAFHATLAPVAYRYPVPERWWREWGIRRYGFHGLSVAWSARRAADLLAQPPGDLGLVVAHLGSGCSVTAVDGGRSVATSMGMTPLEGLMMGTRSGSIDPGIVTRLVADGRLTADAAADALGHHSGLVGVSGRTSDVRELLAAEEAGDERCALALAMFVRSAAAGIAAAATSLGRLDAVVFTGGIGSNSHELRRRIVLRLATLGVPPLPSDDLERETDASIGDPSGPVAVLRVEAREDLVIAAQTGALLGSAGRGTSGQAGVNGPFTRR